MMLAVTHSPADPLPADPATEKVKAREFAKKRLQHYNMGAALRKGKELLQKNADDEDDEED